MRFSQSWTIESVQQPIIPIVGEWIRNNPGTLSLGQGMVSYPPPTSAIEAIRDFGNCPEHHLYGSALGHPELLELITQKLTTENGIDANNGYRIMVTAGSNMAFLNVLMAITDPGDEVILPLPYYFNQEMAVRMLNCFPVPVATDESFQLKIEAIKAAITKKTRAIVTISPNNPSGAVYSDEALRAVNGLCQEYGLFHISDEAYEYFTYGVGQHFSPGSIAGSQRHTISLYSLSKSYGFAGWRIGYMVFPEALLPGLLKIQDTNLICPPQITQCAAIGALRAGSKYCKHQIKQLSYIRQLVAERLARLSIFCQTTITHGAFYFLLKLRTDINDKDIVRKLISDYHVAAIPGCAFGLNDGCYLRISYGMLSEQKMILAMDRLEAGLAALCRNQT